MRRGDADWDDLPLDLQTAVREHDLIELTGWSFAELDSAPAARVERLLLVRKATADASKMTDEARDELVARAIRRRT